MARVKTSPFNTTAKSTAGKKPPCADGTRAHHIVFESPESQEGGIVAGACLKCAYTTTGIASWRMDYATAQIISYRAKVDA